MPLSLPPKSMIRCDAKTAQLVHDQLTSVIAGHTQATTTYRFYEELDVWLGPWRQQGYPIAYGKFYNVAFSTNEKLMADREIHIIADNLSAHKTAKVMAFLDAHPNVQLHYTPTYASWLNQVELWFVKVKLDLLTRGIFTSVTDLARKLWRFITKYNERARPVRWAYADRSRRIA
jgi:transposase